MEAQHTISAVNRGRIVGMWECGANLDEICQRIPCCVRTAKKWIKRWRESGEEGLCDGRRHNHRPRLTTVEQNHDIVRQVDTNPFLPVFDAINALQLPISKMTAIRHLHEAHVHCHRPARKIALSQRHREDRVAFALQELMTSPEEWDVTIWTDEKVFCSAVDNRMHVWRPDNHRRLEICHSSRAKWAYYLCNVGLDKCTLSR